MWYYKVLYICYFTSVNYKNITNTSEVSNYMMLYDVQKT